MTNEGKNEKSLLEDTAEIATICEEDVVSRTEQMPANLNNVLLPDAERCFFQTVEEVARQKCEHYSVNGIFLVHFNDGILCKFDKNTGKISIAHFDGFMRPLRTFDFEDTDKVAGAIRGFARQIEGMASNYTVTANVQRLPENLRISSYFCLALTQSQEEA